LAAGARLAAELPPSVRDAQPLVLGFAETATALGHSVAAAIPGADYVSSTRRPGAGVLAFDEEHSHAVGHQVLAPADVVATGRAVVLVDDELSTGRTAINTMRALQALAPRPSFTVAGLLDLRPAIARQNLQQVADELDAPVSAASLLSGRLHVPPDSLHRAAPAVAAADLPLVTSDEHPVEVVDADWPAGLPLGGRYGWGADLEDDLAGTTKALAALLAERVARLAAAAQVPRVLVLGTEELMYVPLRIAAAMADALDSSAEVRAQSTTRSPVVALDRDGYPVRSALCFPAPDEPDRPSYVYNVPPGGYELIVVVADQPVERAPEPMLAALAGCAPVVYLRLPEPAP
jgi:adenine/guanine phosphoribosyltransferase-like PRPP-binding protein